MAEKDEQIENLKKELEKVPFAVFVHFFVYWNHIIPRPSGHQNLILLIGWTYKYTVNILLPLSSGNPANPLLFLYHNPICTHLYYFSKVL